MMKCIKIIILLVMILGTAFSISNFISVNVNATIGGGDMEGILIDGDCQYNGSLCPIGAERD